MNVTFSMKPNFIATMCGEILCSPWPYAIQCLVEPVVTNHPCSVWGWLLFFFKRTSIVVIV
jgi:hypothetical protein